jgi:hypothetical protein
VTWFGDAYYCNFFLVKYMATTPIPISEVSPNFVGSSVSLCDQSLIPTPQMAQIIGVSLVGA